MPRWQRIIPGSRLQNFVSGNSRIIVLGEQVHWKFWISQFWLDLIDEKMLKFKSLDFDFHSFSSQCESDTWNFPAGTLYGNHQINSLTGKGKEDWNYRNWCLRQSPWDGIFGNGRSPKTLESPFTGNSYAGQKWDHCSAWRCERGEQNNFFNCHWADWIYNAF